MFPSRNLSLSSGIDELKRHAVRVCVAFALAAIAFAGSGAATAAAPEVRTPAEVRIDPKRVVESGRDEDSEDEERALHGRQFNKNRATPEITWLAASTAGRVGR